MFTIDHPQYKVLADAVAQRLAEVTAERAAARASARSVPMAVAVSAGGYANLAEMYPEFRLVQYGFYRPGHADWVASRRLANEWLMLQAQKYGSTAVHIGGSVASYLLSDDLEGQIVVDDSNPVAVHEHHAQTGEAYKYYSSFAQVGEDLGRVLPREKYIDYLAGKGTVVGTTTTMKAVSDVYLVDLSLQLIPPVQLAAAMLETGSSVAFGFFLYSPAMITDSSGELPGSTIRFVRKPEGILLQYPEGPCATGMMKYQDWEPWLVGHTFSVGSVLRRKWFQLELLKNRGSFMFFRMVKLDAAPADVDITHALDVGVAEPMYVVRVPEPVGLDLDMTKMESWHVVPTLVPCRVIDRAYNDAMVLPRNLFTTQAITKKIVAANDRFVVAGTTVKVNSSLGLDIVRRATLAVVSRAFVDRYEAGQLTAEVLGVASRYMSNQGVYEPFSMRRLLCGLACQVFSPAWSLVTKVDTALAAAADWLDSLFNPKFIYEPGEFDEPIGYFRLGEQCAKLTHVVRHAGTEVVVASSAPVWGMPGALVASVAVDNAKSQTVSRLSSAWSVLSTSVWSAELLEKQTDIGYRDYTVEEAKLFEDDVFEEAAEDVLNAAKRSNVVEQASQAMRDLTATVVVGESVPFAEGAPVVSDDPVGDLNRFYATVNPGVAPQDLEQDTASIALDPQDRYVTAVRLAGPTDMSSVPKPRDVYLSRIEALNVSKRQNTLQELLSATASRNLSAPQVSLPQNEDAAIQDIWKVFLDTACVPDAREKIESFKSDPVALTEFGLADWARQVTPDKRARVIKALEDGTEALEQMDVGEYMLMLKADVKPDLTRKPIENRIEPQVIAYHKPELNALFSAIFRVVLRRFLSLLKPNYKLVLLKDLREVERVLQNVHPFGGVFKYLENDFSKYDKSQGRFVYLLEAFVFTEMGMDESLLAHWLSGHKFAKMRSVALLMSLHVEYQRKSGDATTAGGNGILNILSVTYAYKGTDVVWAIFMGDDSLVCARRVGGDKSAVRVLAEVFNLGAKTFVTDSPYFASNFLAIDDDNAVLRFIPDPVKRAARWSMSVSADNPMWHERWISARDACRAYGDEACLTVLPRLVCQRYEVDSTSVELAVRAVAAAIGSEEVFRSLWEKEPTVITYG
jgi:hypothetical protein